MQEVPACHDPALPPKLPQNTLPSCLHFWVSISKRSPSDGWGQSTSSAVMEVCTFGSSNAGVNGMIQHRVSIGKLPTAATGIDLDFQGRAQCLLLSVPQTQWPDKSIQTSTSWFIQCTCVYTAPMTSGLHTPCHQQACSRLTLVKRWRKKKSFEGQFFIFFSKLTAIKKVGAKRNLKFCHFGSTNIRRV